MKRLKILLVVLLSLVLFSENIFAVTNGQLTQKENQINYTKISERNGILLDVARCQLNKQQINQIIDQINPQKFSYIVLHLNDDQHVSFRSKIIGNQNDPKALSVNDLKELTANAQRHHLMLVPDFDTPGHCKALIKLLKVHHPKLAQQIMLNDNTLNYLSHKTEKFVQKINEEINTACHKQQYPYILLGGDEIAASGNHNRALMKYFNELNTFENHHGYRSIIWNDSIMKNADLSNKITVAYWAQAGANSAKQDLQTAFNERATVVDLINHPLINANAEYNYFDLENLNNSSKIEYFVNQFNQNNVKNFDLIDSQSWENNAKSNQNEVATDGQLVCLWGENQHFDFKRLLYLIKKLN